LYVGSIQISIALGPLLGGIIVDWAGLSIALYDGAAVAALSFITIVQWRETGLLRHIDEPQSLEWQTRSLIPVSPRFAEEIAVMMHF
jgi:MFS family permease